MREYPVDVPVGAISSLTRILRARTRRAEGREFSHAIWIVRGYLMRATIGAPTPGAGDDGQPLQPDRPTPPITEEARNHFGELHALLAKSKPLAGQDELVAMLVDDEQEAIYHTLTLWLSGDLPLSPPPTETAAPTAVVEPPAPLGPQPEPTKPGGGRVSTEAQPAAVEHAPELTEPSQKRGARDR
jgi:hypothetical protein